LQLEEQASIERRGAEEGGRFIGSLEAGFVTERSELGSCRAFRVQYPILNEVLRREGKRFIYNRDC
jgi:hypothetical protein